MSKNYDGYRAVFSTLPSRIRRVDARPEPDHQGRAVAVRAIGDITSSTGADGASYASTIKPTPPHANSTVPGAPPRLFARRCASITR